MGLDYDDLPSSGRRGKARELILYCQRTGRLDELLTLCRRERPHIGWDAFSQPPPAVEELRTVAHEGGSDIFLSYSRKDSPTKDRLARDLRQAGFSVWTDDGLVPGTPSWHQAIESEIESTDCLVVLLSPDAKRSVWVRRELDYGVAQGKRIFPAMVRGARTSAIPITIIDAQFVDLRQDYPGGLAKLRDALKSYLEKPAEDTQDAAPAADPFAPPEGVAIPHIVTGRRPLNIEWCWVPAGTFTMGSEEDDSEKPVHQVRLDGFWLARCPVTNAQYRHFVEAGGYEQRRWWGEAGWAWREEEGITQPGYWTDGKWNGDRQPVVDVSWYEALAFARWAAEETGEPIRLPTEAEWEKAARGADQRIYPWGDSEPTDELANFNDNVGQTTPVGRYSPAGDGPYGNADMAGNVWEWTSTLYMPYPYDAGDGRDNVTSGGNQVMRGGSWYGFQGFARTSFRNFVLPYNRNLNSGFRLARQSQS